MIKIQFEPEKHRSAAYDQEKCIGECTYTTDIPDEWNINHTFVLLSIQLMVDRELPVN